MVVRLIRAKYYPTSDFLNARLGSNPSLIWKSIWSARGLLEMGLRWKVGCGRSISMWNDFWLPDWIPRLVSSLPVSGISNVADLIDTLSGSWKTDLILNSFSTHDAEVILSIPLPSCYQYDVLVWCGEHTGIYTARSGYRRLLDSTGTPPIESNLYRKVWQSQCPAKMNIQCWKFIKNFVPTRTNLCFRKLAADPLCNKCFQAPEDVIHVICDCFYAKQLWSALWIREPTNAIYLSFREWLEEVFNINGIQNTQEIITTIYALWFARNKLVFEGIITRVEEIITYVKGYCLDLQLTQSSLSPGSTQVTVRWRPPIAPAVKINVDASFYLATNSANMGIVIRDSEDFILGAKCSKMECISSCFAAEAYAVVHGLRLAADLGFRHVVVEGDSLSVIEKLKSGLDDRLDISAIVWNAQMLAQNFRTCTFSFIPRNGNFPVHAMAKESFNFSSERVWVEEAPDAVVHLAAEDRRWIDPP
ncbi:hypothetical protein like AT4G29090 [Hibiscus trionum]|uniref:Uncharacterized protein n=1 Tax=Hibiscus trionum TaxID=183268 RepID=A0A9W7M4J5_HIBTR|nr:hypothetical protein like AT4G29090 [Hibiscus trionum]